MVEGEPAPSALNCVHHWVIESPAPGLEFFLGRCKICNIERQYDNKSIEYDSWRPPKKGKPKNGDGILI